MSSILGAQLAAYLTMHAADLMHQCQIPSTFKTNCLSFILSHNIIRPPDEKSYFQPFDSSHPPLCRLLLSLIS
jgi:hypothetical protein